MQRCFRPDETNLEQRKKEAIFLMNDERELYTPVINEAKWWI
jgi:hypothetical protein